MTSQHCSSPGTTEPAVSSAVAASAPREGCPVPGSPSRLCPRAPLHSLIEAQSKGEARSRSPRKDSPRPSHPAVPTLTPHSCPLIRTVGPAPQDALLYHGTASGVFLGGPGLRVPVPLQCIGHSALCLHLQSAHVLAGARAFAQGPCRSPLPSSHSFPGAWGSEEGSLVQCYRCHRPHPSPRLATHWRWPRGRKGWPLTPGLQSPCSVLQPWVSRAVSNGLGSP